MKIITVGALKGGVGKTNFTFNLAGILAFNNKKVLLIDLDPQANLSNNFKITNSSSSSKKLFEQNVDIIKSNLIIKNINLHENIHIIPTNIAMTTLETELINRTAREGTLQRTFIKNYELLKAYDYVIIDTNPSINIINKNAFVIADEIIIISDNSINSLSAVNLLTNTWQEMCKELRINNNINTIVLNNFDHYKISKDFTEFIGNSQFKEKILKTQIRSKQALKKSEIVGIPLALSKSVKLETNPYHHIYNELIERGVL